MEGTIKLSILVLLAILQLHSTSSQDLTDIFTCVDTIAKGYEEAERVGKPIMLIVHKNSCGACRRLKPKLQESTAVRTYSENFVVVNAANGNDQKAELLGPNYYPRILFFGPDRTPLNVKNAKNPKYAYYYEFAEDLYISMQNAVKLSRKRKF